MKNIFGINKIIIALLFLSGVTYSSCKKYLDITPQGKTILTTFDDFNQLLNSENPNYSPCVFPEDEMKFLNDQRGIEDGGVITATIGVTQLEYLYDTSVSRLVAGISSNFYTKVYAGIARCCLIIENTGSATGGTDLQKKQLIAEARAVRAYDHFGLVNLYARPYNPVTAATDNAIPIKTKLDITETVSPSTTQQVYDFVEKELLASIPDLSNTPENALHPSKAFAYALLAKVYLFTGRIDKAQQAAQQALALNDYIEDMVAYKAQPHPVDVNAKENLYFSSPTFTNYPYNERISKEMYNFYGTDASDLRQVVFFTNGIGGTANIASTAFTMNITSASNPNAYTYNITGIRTTDVYLMLAECYARQGDITNAIKYVDAVRVKRIVPAKFTPSVATDKKSAMTMVMNERRKEFLFGYSRFWDLRRLGQEPDYAITAQRDYPITGATKTYTCPPTSYLYTIPIDMKTMLLNTTLKENTNDAVNW